MSSFSTRSDERDSLFMVADLQFDAADDPYAEPLRAKVRNLSAGGMMVEREMPVKRGQKVQVVLRNLEPVSGVVVWARSPLFGIAFDQPIDPRQARTQVFGTAPPAPAYTTPHVIPPRTGNWSGKLRPV